MQPPTPLVLEFELQVPMDASLGQHSDDIRGDNNEHAIALTWYTLGGRTPCSPFYLFFFLLLLPYLSSFFL